MVKGRGHGRRRIFKEPVSGIRNTKKLSRKTRIAHGCLLGGKLGVFFPRHPNQAPGQTLRIGELVGHGKSAECGSQFGPVEIFFRPGANGTVTKNVLFVPTVDERTPCRGSKRGGPCCVRLASLGAIFIGLKIARIDRKQKRAAPPVRIILHPAQSQTRAERITRQPARAFNARRRERRTRGEKIRTNPIRVDHRRRAHGIPIAALSEKTVQCNDRRFHEATRRSRVRR